MGNAHGAISSRPVGLNSICWRTPSRLLGICVAGTACFECRAFVRAPPRPSPRWRLAVRGEGALPPVAVNCRVAPTQAATTRRTLWAELHQLQPVALARNPAESPAWWTPRRAVEADGSRTTGSCHQLRYEVSLRCTLHAIHRIGPEWWAQPTSLAIDRGILASTHLKRAAMRSSCTVEAGTTSGAASISRPCRVKTRRCLTL
jgi:hypothetical protein